jgi:hypothetical protein
MVARPLQPRRPGGQRVEACGDVEGSQLPTKLLCSVSYRVALVDAGTKGSKTLCWREMDSNHQFRESKPNAGTVCS